MRTRLFHRTGGGFGFDDLIAFTAQRFEGQSSCVCAVIDNQNATIGQNASLDMEFRSDFNRSDMEFRKVARIDDCVNFKSCYDEARCDRAGRSE